MMNDKQIKRFWPQNEKQNSGQYLNHSAPAVKEKDEHTPFFLLPIV
jgi:hypothetical protein